VTHAGRITWLEHRGKENDMHWRQFMDSDWLTAFDIMDEEGGSRDVNVQIDRVEQGKVSNAEKRDQRKPVIFFKGKKKPLAAGVTVCKTIERMHGSDPRKWGSCWVTLYVGEASVAGETRPAIRVRPRAPAAGKSNGKDQPAAPAQPAAEQGDREPGAEG
jgi:hypothetical protein